MATEIEELEGELEKFFKRYMKLTGATWTLIGVFK